MSQSNGPVNECEYEKENQSALCTNFFANPEIKFKFKLNSKRGYTIHKISL